MRGITMDLIVQRSTSLEAAITEKKIYPGLYDNKADKTCNTNLVLALKLEGRSQHTNKSENSTKFSAVRVFKTLLRTDQSKVTWSKASKNTRNQNIDRKEQDRCCRTRGSRPRNTDSWRIDVWLGRRLC
jgi:hypothetical protein